MRILKTPNSDSLSDSELREVEGLDAEYFVYNYQEGDYEGSGWAIWKFNDGKFGYTSLGHCSCNGPVEDLNSIPYTLDEIKQFSDKYYADFSDEVIELVEAIEAHG